MKAIRIAIVLLLFGSFWALSSGCGMPRVELKPEGPPPTLEQALKNFAYEKKPFDVQMQFMEDRPGYEIFRVTFPSYFQDQLDAKEVVAWYYRVKDPHRRAGIIQVPILGGDYSESIWFAEFYAREGFHVLRFERKAELFEPDTGLPKTRTVLVGTVVDMQRGLDWWETLPEIDAKRIGVSGISMGGFFSSMLLAVDDRPAAAVLMLNGGNLAKLIVISQEEEVVLVRNAYKKRTGWDDQAFYREAYKATADLDPAVLAPRLDPKKILFVSPRFDQVVPWELSSLWWNAAHQPRRIVIPTGHYSSVFFIFYIQKQAVEHFRRQFGYPVQQ